MTPPPLQVRQDIEYILSDAVLGGYHPDELALLRVALRRYLETGNAQDAAAWAAKELAGSLGRT